jgi:ribonucleoside-diphosphate reductase alpha subunit
MKVVKRSGESQEMLFDKVTDRIKKLSHGLDGVSPDKVAQKTFYEMFDGISTSKIDDLSADIAANMMTIDPDYEVIASRILVSNMHKTYPKKFSECMKTISTVTDEIKEHAEKFDDLIVRDRDYLFGFFGLKTMQKVYLSAGETPQYMFMRVALGIHGCDDIRVVKETYDLLSLKKFTHATPTMINAGMNMPQMSSCFLTSVEDSIEGIYRNIGKCAQISKHAGGIGIHAQDIRSKGSAIRGTNGTSDGIIPMLRVYNATARYVNQCFKGDTLVYSTCGPKRIDEVKIGDFLVTIDGTSKRVNEVIRNHVHKDVKVIRPMHSLEPVTVTSEHDIYAITAQAKMLNYNVIRNRLEKNIISPEFVSAGSLKEGDFVGFPIPKEIVDFPESADYFRFYGIMVGDGHIMKNRNECGLSLGVSNVDTYKFSVNFLESRGIHVWHSFKNNTYMIRWTCNVDKLNITRKMLYNSSDEKIIDARFLHLPLDKTYSLIKGLMETDGSITHEIQFFNTSKNVVYSLRYLFFRIGVLSSGHVSDYVGETHEIRDTNRKISWSLRIPKQENLRPIFGDSVSYSTTLKYFEWDGIMWSRIKNIQTSHYEGYVYDLNMQDNHNYLTDMGLVHNSGRRKGSFAVYLEPWHPDIFDFLELRLNQGDEDVRCRDLFTAMWIPDKFMRAVESGGNWALFDPSECPGLSDVYGPMFDQLYDLYLSEGRARKIVPALSIWQAIIKSQIETGTPYMLYKDTCNARSNQQNLGTLKGSNLCSEILEYTSKDEIAVCNLASIALPEYIRNGDFDFEELHSVTKVITRNLNKVIDRNFYPVPEARKSNMRHRPIGIGVQGLADVYILMGLPFDSPEAAKLNTRISECVYHAALEASVELAREHGRYESFSGSPACEGLLQFDLAGASTKFEWHYDWDTTRRQVRQTGLRNSLLIAPMPTATTSQVLGNNECFEPYTSNLYLRRTIAGEFVVVNRHLVRALQKLGMWNEDMKNEIIRDNGSVQNIQKVPMKLKGLFKTAWELSQKVLIDQARDRGYFVCQTQSLNLFVESPTIAKLSSMHMYGWKEGLKTGMYYLRTRPKAAPIQVTLEPVCAACSS